MNKETATPERYYLGLATFENFWGEDLSSVVIEHYVNNLSNSRTKKYPSSQTLSNIANKAVMKDIFVFKYEIGINDSYDYWVVEITTKSGKNIVQNRAFIVLLPLKIKEKWFWGLMGL
ncbi:hypothetical protein AB6G21_19515 [Providencia hangzhouensis]|uniref:hypothetical protein n=1 Tax=Providencia hangzhouensis TaxID=3031799 RepID=UPI0034DD4A53